MFSECSQDLSGRAARETRGWRVKRPLAANFWRAGACAIEGQLMDSLLADGDELELTPDPPWQWLVPVKVPVTGFHQIKSEGKSVILEADIILAGLKAAGKQYTAPGFDAPGTSVLVTLSVNAATLSASVTEGGQKVGTIATTGTFTAMMVPAMNPAAGVPDPVVSKTGTWKVATEKQSSARSGDPKSLEADGDEPEESGEGSGKGAHRTTSKAGKREVFWVAIEVEDEEDQPLAGQKVGITTPDGRYYIRELNGSGSTRIDGIPVEGECTVTLLGWQPTKAAPSIAENHWIEFEFADEDGSALADHRIVITTPAGRRYQRRLDAEGRARVEAIPEKGACSVEIFPLPPAERRATANTATASTATANTPKDHWVALELVDREEKPISNRRVAIMTGDGRRIEKVTNNEGHVRVDGVQSAAECRVLLIGRDSPP